ncbi:MULTISPECIES: BON domain-containing protein [Citrobacter]|uniref:BON domain-containing protein n=1 Tax=Citrobacter TaxID=544 RepID=UPI0011EFFFFF|nr:BON domain-containing protein [Citrobacter braakii]
MGRINVVNTFCLSGIFSTLLAGCAPGAKKEGTGINVETFKGRVQLSGSVSSADAVKTAVAATQKISGVQAVENDMRIR